jgi:hypothetical protein
MVQTVTVKVELKSKPSRSCDGCTKCCDGTLNTEVFDQRLYPGSPCKYVAFDVGCTVHEERPEYPCRIFQCQWIEDDSLPAWIKPSISGVIIMTKEVDGIPFVQMTSGIHPPTVETLSWFFTWAKSKYENVYWTLGTAFYYLGSQEFCDAIAKNPQNVL